MRACLEAGCHYLDLGGLYWMTGRQLELHDASSSGAGLLGAARDGLEPGQDQRDGGARGARAGRAAASGST